MASKQHWLTILLSPPPGDKKQRISHRQSITLKAYFDENPGALDAGEHLEGKSTRANGDNFRLDAEHSGPALTVSNEQRFDFLISEQEFAAANFSIYVWIEPLGYATLRSTAHEGIAVGRQHLRPGHVNKGGLSSPPPNSRSGDEQIVCRMTLVGSVADFMSNEMNTNGQSDEVKKMSAYLKFDEGPKWMTGQYPNIGARYADSILGCRTHSNEGDWKDFAQDLYFCGGREGGQWDHKPIIRPIWGARNRLGNSGFVYYYDAWSNIHFGYIAAKVGFPLNHVLNAAGQAQGLDSGTASSDDDPVDAQAIKEGYALGRKQSSVTIADLISIFQRNQDWEGR
ncbi:polymorphic toxin type 44 domain-containing protein [Agrobacterium rosae]|uniref:polymorphic toxin type 44 domain-containing protein n=1 Tax=Agrobacterium rosae TaxID=1972867 RepID=UPI003A812505